MLRTDSSFNNNKNNNTTTIITRGRNNNNNKGCYSFFMMSKMVVALLLQLLFALQLIGHTADGFSTLTTTKTVTTTARKTALASTTTTTTRRSFDAFVTSVSSRTRFDTRLNLFGGPKDDGSPGDYVCKDCGYVFTKGPKAWANLPDNYQCPPCGAPKFRFNKVPKGSAKGKVNVKKSWF